MKWFKENLYTKTYIPGQMLVILIKITDQIGILFEQNWTTASTTSMSMQKNNLKSVYPGLKSRKCTLKKYKYRFPS